MMKRFLILLFACGLACGAARAQTPVPQGPTHAASSQTSPELAEAERLNAQMFRLYRAGQTEEALPLARRVLEIRGQALGGEHLLVAYSLNNLGSIYLAQKKHGEAEPLLRRALQIAEKGGDPARELLIEIHNQLAVLDSRENDLRGAEEHLERALALSETVRGADHPGNLNLRLNLAEINYQRLHSREAEGHLSKAIELVLKQPPAKDQRTAERLKRFWCLRTEPEPRPELDAQLAKAVEWLEEPERAAAKAEGVKALEVDGQVLNRRAKSRVAPNYPGKAKGDRVQGRVVVRILVDEAGKVVEAQALCGHEDLTEAAVKAVSQWRFTPTLVDGLPVKVTGRVTVHFNLN